MLAAPIKIGPLHLDPPVVLAPMAGVTNATFRALCAGQGAALYVSEMITARALVEGNARTLRMVQFADAEACRSVQLYGVDPQVMAAAVGRLVGEIGVDHIDLNFGCPVPKVTRKGGGAALPVHRVLFRSVVRAAVIAAGAVPVTVKLRIGVDDLHPTSVAAGLAAEDEGAAAVILHARTAEALYAGAARWEAIAELKAAVTSVPVLGNGDIWEASDALAMMAATGCDGVVVGRGCLGRPWLFRDLAAVLGGRAQEAPPSLGEILTMLRTHAAGLIDAIGEDAGMRDFRKHIGWYLTGFPIGGDQRRRVAPVSTQSELETQLGQLDPGLPFPAEARRLPRGHTDGPRRVVVPPGWMDSVDDPAAPSGADSWVSGG